MALATSRACILFIVTILLAQNCYASTKGPRFSARLAKPASPAETAAKNPANPNAFYNIYEIGRMADFYEKKYNLQRAHVLRIISIAVENAHEKKISPFVVLAIISHESNFVAYARNRSGATGLMQILTSIHHHRFKPYGGSQNALKPEVNIKIGTDILEECIKKMKSVRGGLRCYAGTVKGNDRGFADYVLREATDLKEKSKK